MISVLASRDNLLPECILFKTILTNNVQNGNIVYGSNWVDNTFGLGWVIHLGNALLSRIGCGVLSLLLSYYTLFKNEY